MQVGVYLRLTASQALDSRSPVLCAALALGLGSSAFALQLLAFPPRSDAAGPGAATYQDIAQLDLPQFDAVSESGSLPATGDSFAGDAAYAAGELAASAADGSGSEQAADAGGDGTAL